MKKIVGILIIFAIMFAISGCSYQEANNSNNSKLLLTSISLMQENKFKESFDSIQKSSSEDKKIVESIIIQTFLKKTSAATTLMNNEVETASDVVKNVLMNNILTGKINVSASDQQRIDLIYDQMKPYLELEDTYSKEILSNDMSNYYDSYFDLLNSSIGLFSDLQSKLRNDKDGLMSSVNIVSTKLQSFANETKNLGDKYTTNEIPSDYIILFDL